MTDILAMKLAYPEERTLCHKFCLSDDLLSSPLKEKVAVHLICYKRDATEAGLYLNLTVNTPNGKEGPFNLDQEK